MKHIYTVTGMTCNGCKASVEKALSKLSDVNKASVNLKSSEVILEMNSHISLQTLQETLSSKYTISEKKGSYSS